MKVNMKKLLGNQEDDLCFLCGCKRIRTLWSMLQNSEHSRLMTLLDLKNFCFVFLYWFNFNSIKGLVREVFDSLH